MPFNSPELVRESLGSDLAAVRRLSYQASSDLAAEKGSFPLFDRSRYLAGETMQPVSLGRFRLRRSHLVLTRSLGCHRLG